ncbi:MULTISPECIES: hypothetical protein [unclassified Thalassospira]|jgi:hypothetical protein|uniref:hypothetical protein n=1 Tax=unclassified Thalassospira TaxID=2648997 RepID=UPI001B268A21|nr:hypothetical protein [Thalassospira sp.]MBO6773792.1 hypothetical protein [Thalassospira sp.]|tara:strand:+ start:312 stop:689 length:378 start_codon:yes stop_codon:yes gene_type:complete
MQTTNLREKADKLFPRQPVKTVLKVLGISALVFVLSTWIGMNSKGGTEATMAWVAIILITGAAGLFGRGFGGVALAACAGFTFYLCRWIQDLAHGRYERVALKNKQLIDWVAIIFFVIVPTIFAL